MNILKHAKSIHKAPQYIQAARVFMAAMPKLPPEDQNVDHPVSIYAATKKSNELMAHSYNHLFNLPTTGLRFFTVYGPWKADMALFLFTKAIIENKTIDVYNHGNMVEIYL